MNKKATRLAYGEVLAEYAGDPRIVVLDADLSNCTETRLFAEKCPTHFINCGIAEANMINVAAGLATCGNIAFANSFAMFIAGRCFEQIRNSVCYPNLNVKLVGTHAGLSVGEDGATHQCLEDIGLMRTIPNMTILCPCDANETRLAVQSAIQHEGPVYLRLGRLPVPDITGTIPGYTFILGKGIELRPGNDITLIATGIMVHEALKAADSLELHGIQARIIDMPTIKPLDRDIILKAADETNAILTLEEHNRYGGLTEAVATTLLEAGKATTFDWIAVDDAFGHSGSPDVLFENYALNSTYIEKKALALLKQEHITPSYHNNTGN